MKKYSFILLGLMLMMSQASMAITCSQQKVHYINDTITPLKCQFIETLKSTYSNPRYVSFFEFDGSDNTWLSSDKSLPFSFTYPQERVIIVAAGEDLIPAAPARVAEMTEEAAEALATGEIDCSLLPNNYATGFIIRQYDIYRIKIYQNLVIEHWDTITANFLTRIADAEMYTTDNDPEYCDRRAWGKYYLYQNTTQRDYNTNGTFVRQLSSSTSDYTFWVLTGIERISAPARAAQALADLYLRPYPNPSGFDVHHADLWHIHVIQPTCENNLMYRKWDDVMFIDNGGNSPKFDRGDFVSYQWYLDENEIEGATEQWYQPTNADGTKAVKPSTTGQYYTRLTTQNGKVYYTCPCKFSAMPTSYNKNQHTGKDIDTKASKRIVNGQLIIECDGATYNAMGLKF